MKKKLKIIYDISLMSKDSNRDSERSGIFFVTKDILEELQKRTNIDLYIYNNCYDYSFIKNKKNVKIITIDNLFYQKVKRFYNNLLSFKKKMKNYARKSKNIFIKFLILFLRKFLDVVLIFFSNFLCIYDFFEKYRKFNIKADIFLSTIYKIPSVIKENNNIKNFVIIHDFIPFILDDYKYKAGKGGWFEELMKSIDGKKNEYFFTISRNTNKDFFKFNKNIDKNNVFTIPLATSNGDFYPNKNRKQYLEICKKYNIPKDKFYFFSLSNFDPRKNIKHSIKCFIDLIKKYKINDLYFVMAGFSNKEKMEKLFSDLKIKDKLKKKFIMTGYVDDLDRASLYSNAMCFIYPSLYEGFGLPPLEAMKCGTPVITSNTSSLPEVVGDAGIMIDPKSQKQLIDAMYKLYKDKKLRKNLSEKGLKRAKMFSWKKTVDEMIKKFREV